MDGQITQFERGGGWYTEQANMIGLAQPRCYVRVTLISRNGHIEAYMFVVGLV